MELLICFTVLNMLKRKNRKKIVGVRITETLHQQLEEVTENRGEDISSFVRRAILMELGRLSLLGDEEKRALGIESGGF